MLIQPSLKGKNSFEASVDKLLLKRKLSNPSNIIKSLNVFSNSSLGTNANNNATKSIKSTVIKIDDNLKNKILEKSKDIINNKLETSDKGRKSNLSDKLSEYKRPTGSIIDIRT